VDANTKKLETLRRLGAKVCAGCGTIGQETATCEVCRSRIVAARAQRQRESDERFNAQMMRLAREEQELRNRLSMEQSMRPNNRAYRQQVLDHADDIKDAMSEWDMGNGLFGGTPID